MDDPFQKVRPLTRIIPLQTQPITVMHLCNLNHRLKVLQTEFTSLFMKNEAIYKDVLLEQWAKKAISNVYKLKIWGVYSREALKERGV